MAGTAEGTTDGWHGDLLMPSAVRWWLLRTLRPEQRLMRAVLEEALVELAAERVELTSSLPDDQHRRELLKWFASRDRSWPCSFENVCDAIDLDPERLRGLLGTVVRPCRQ